MARARAAALEPKVSSVVVRVAKEEIAGLEIRREGELLGRAVWGSAMPVDPGRYTFVAQAPGKKSWSQTIEVGTGGAEVDVTVPSLADDDGRSATGMSGLSTATDAAASPTADRQGRGNTQRTAGYLLAGLGVIGAGASAVFGLKVVSLLDERDAICRSNDCTPDEGLSIREIEANAQSNATAFNVALPLGAAAALGGIMLVLTAPSSSSPSASPLRFVPWAGPTSAGANLAGHW